MNRIPFNIASLLVIILIIGVGFAALRESNDLWDNGVFTLTFAALLISILLAIHRTESRRSFWIGFAAFGWTYLVVSMVPTIESRLITTKGLAYLDSKVPGRPILLLGTFTNSGTGSGTGNNQVSNVTFTLSGTQSSTAGPGQVSVWDVPTGKLLGGMSGASENFVRIGHSLFALLAAWLGGQLSRRLYRSSRWQEPNTPVAVEGTGP